MKRQTSAEGKGATSLFVVGKSRVLEHSYHDAPNRLKLSI